MLSITDQYQKQLNFLKLKCDACGHEMKIIFKIIFVVFTLLQCCNPLIGNPNDHSGVIFSVEEKKWLDEFIEQVFLNNTMIYTLFGTKPMSDVTICIASENDCIKASSQYLAKLNKEEKEIFLKKLHEGCENDNFNAYFQKWCNLLKKHPSNKFLFRSSISDNNHYLLIDMINIQEVVWILKDYYAVFSKETGIEYEPTSIVYEFDNINSVFWKTVFSNHYLLGLLYGFGDKNAYFFSNYMDKTKNYNFLDSSVNNNDFFGRKEPISIKNLSIPTFRSFYFAAIEDPVISKYKIEQSTIQNYLMGKDFTLEVLKRIFD